VVGNVDWGDVEEGSRAWMRLGDVAGVKEVDGMSGLCGVMSNARGWSRD